ncbi:hypothetical protein QC762_122160 [Podospora pseudocomata]|uniref:SMP-30/Gluconolactonase/LRE-like region domain-containing protein n=1 Tax=Podospora pseudocomata TaxID=2093779 RepID=A0ABR0GYV9_9PEZI|nr:hypothetical protein QC762_122160 [Podospora pseudocomata]
MPPLQFGKSFLSSAVFLGVAISTPDLFHAERQSFAAQAQRIDQRAFNVLPTVPPPSEYGGFIAWIPFAPPNATIESLVARPFHIYSKEFEDIIGPNPTLTLLNHTDGDPLFHEAPVWNPSTDEMFFCQNAGAPAAGTGMQKSAIIQKIKLSAITRAITSQRNASGSVQIEDVTAADGAKVMNPNGGTNYKNKLLFVGQGKGENIPPAIYLMNPEPPYDTKGRLGSLRASSVYHVLTSGGYLVMLNNYFGRQFNSINDASVNPRNGDIYFTDPTYGFVQDFRPAPGFPKQVWRFNEATGAVTVVADGFSMPNGIQFSPSGSHLYVTDSGVAQAFRGMEYNNPSTIYRFDVSRDGTLSNRQTFAFITPGIPDGINVDTNGNVYVGCADGVQVYSPSGKLIGKIFLGKGVANFQFAGKGRMVLLAETELYFVGGLKAEGAFPGRLY